MDLLEAMIISDMLSQGYYPWDETDINAYWEGLL
jgi:hypothetical protein